MSRLLRVPTPPTFTAPWTWPLWCARPLGLGRKCGALLTNVVREPVSIGAFADEPWEHYIPGPEIQHRPCGHIWGPGGWLN